jgi:hypothetical protein
MFQKNDEERTMAAQERPDAEPKDGLADAVDTASPVIAKEPERDASAEMIEDAVTVDEVEKDTPVAPEPGDTEQARLDSVQAPTPPAPPAAQSSGSQGGFVGMVVGGIIAGAIGYGLAIYAPLGGASDLPGQVATLKSQTAALTDRLAGVEAAPPAPTTVPALEARVAALEEAPAPSAAPVDLAPIEAQLTQIIDRLKAVEGRVTEVESRSAMTEGTSATSPEMEAAVASLRQEIDSLKGAGAAATADIEAMAAEAQARLAEAEERATQLKADAEATAQKALARAAVGRVQAALESGAPFETALADMASFEVPPVLRDAAAGGIASRAALEDAFPTAARAALEASLRANAGESWTERMGAFLQSTTGARSLTPREGNDPDAILSRAEAAVKADDLRAALGELAALPPEGQAAMADWVAQANRRLEAVQAAADLSTAIDG